MPIITRDVYCNFLTGTYEVLGVSYMLTDLIENVFAPKPIVITADGVQCTAISPNESIPLSTGPYNTTVGNLYQTGFLVIMAFKGHIDGLCHEPLVGSDTISGNQGFDVGYVSTTPVATLNDGSGGGGNLITLTALGLDNVNQIAAIIDPVAGKMAFSVNGSDVSITDYVQTPLSAAHYQDSYIIGDLVNIGGWVRYIAYYAATIDQAPQLFLWSVDTPPAEIVSVSMTGVSSLAAPGYTNRVRMTRSYTDGF
jgi:hypothetical protein